MGAPGEGELQVARPAWPGRLLAVMAMIASAAAGIAFEYRIDFITVCFPLGVTESFREANPELPHNNSFGV
jgi:hypothetical protein